MVGVVRTGVSKGDVIVLLNPNETEVVAWFKIKEFTVAQEIEVEDSEGRIFTNRGKKDMWVHQFVLLRLPLAPYVKSTKNGYKNIIEIHVNDFYRVHYLGFLKMTKPSLYHTLPKELRCQ